MLTTEIWLRMSMVKGLAVARSCTIAKHLIAYADLHSDVLTAVGLDESQSRQFIHASTHYIAATLAWLEHPDHHMLIYGYPTYPQRLSHISSAPLLLFITGDVSVVSQLQIAMVGSRNFSHYGERWARYFTEKLIEQGLVITSGLATGIDGICHHSALSVQGKTIAVLGSGLENIYPRHHYGLAHRIVEQGGALVSEFLVTSPPLATHFPRRNRIISGLSAAVVVVEASLKSGSLITARYALEQGRDVFALPGPLGSPTSAGVHWLIQQGAYLANDPQDIIEQLGGSFQWLPTSEKPSLPKEQMTLPFADVLAHIEYDVTPVDIIAERVDQSVSELVIKLLELELAGWITAVPGGYVRVTGV
ncbi:DNA protecting protein DprA [Candidatus Regiella insecticola 5.15]|uniref:DNA protecting protein DprA n=1 Tax=Candidatus Regiella insecticola 5.15 TaxID=1005043 RepID=G2H0Q4_9ENTR|nr:DNA-protecting protein DprA [Candidatus Regiella insecticola]EGY28425.1 DNA protecting protein DprA [Candidatus Regiella insecticola 5.15]